MVTIIELWEHDPPNADVFPIFDPWKILHEHTVFYDMLMVSLDIGDLSHVLWSHDLPPDHGKAKMASELPHTWAVEGPSMENPVLGKPEMEMQVACLKTFISGLHPSDGTESRVCGWCTL